VGRGDRQWFNRGVGTKPSRPGLAHVNVHTGYKEPSMPFGGVKQSGAEYLRG
jgi:acyl-CoA reductase-like NAD-dependent aldehyde dehydrogenase